MAIFIAQLSVVPEVCRNDWLQLVVMLVAASIERSLPRLLFRVQTKITFQIYTWPYLLLWICPG